MPSTTVFWFYLEIAHQCLFVRMAVEYLVFYRTGPSDGLDREYYHLQSLLVAMGNISKILWPVMRRGDKEGNDLRKARGRELREAIGIRRDSVLRSRVLRDTFEHLDERMDKWFGATKRSGFADRGIGSMEGVVNPRPEDRIRTFIPKTWTVVFCGKEFQLSPSIKAVCDLYDAVQKRISQPGHENRLLPGKIENEIDNAKKK